MFAGEWPQTACSISRNVFEGYSVTWVRQLHRILFGRSHWPQRKGAKRFGENRSLSKRHQGADIGRGQLPRNCKWRRGDGEELPSGMYMTQRRSAPRMGGYESGPGESNNNDDSVSNGSAARAVDGEKKEVSPGKNGSTRQEIDCPDPKETRHIPHPDIERWVVVCMMGL